MATADDPDLRLQQYLDANEHYRRWWEGFVGELEAALPHTRGAWRLTGSRAFGLAYPESDIEGAVLCPADEQPALQNDLSSYLTSRGLEHTATATQAGLRMLTVPEVHRGAEVDIWKLEITLRTAETHDRICRHIDDQLATWTPEQRLSYIDVQRADFLAKDGDPAATERYNGRKGWLKALPPRS